MIGADPATPSRPARTATAGLQSRSARYAALVRALLDRPHTPSGDPQAETLLCASLIDERNTFRRFMSARTKFIDDRLLEALDNGISQVVILGAGYDGRALRFRSPGVTFFELDLQAVQDDKRRRLHALGLDISQLLLVPADLAADSIAEVLQPTGHDPLRCTLFICEGVLLYLPPGAIDGVLTGARSCAAPGSVLAATFAIGHPAMAPGPPLSPADAAERRQSFFTPGSVRNLLHRCGWSLDLAVNPGPGTRAADDVALFVRATPGERRPPGPALPCQAHDPAGGQ